VSTQPLAIDVKQSVVAANQAPSVTMTAPLNGAVLPAGAAITLAAAPKDVDGSVARVDFYEGTTLLGSGTAPGFLMSWVVRSTKPSYTFKAVAVDNAGATAASATVTISVRSEIVLRASQSTRMAGDFALNADATAAGGYSLLNVNRNLPKVTTPVATPASYAEFTFYAEAGRPYHLWIRGRADRNDYTNDSVYVQFDNVAAARIGSTSAMSVTLEDGASVGLAGWGWQDNGYGVGVLGAHVTFEKTGLQTIRFQPREDGLAIDQIVLSPARYLTAAPGATKNDTTILAQ
jgi:hypothetical protein